MATINGLNISDGTNYVTTEITFRSSPSRIARSVNISRRPGDKLTALEWSSKEINIKGAVFSTTVSGLRGLVDTLQYNFSIKGLSLSIDSDRSYTANLTKLDIPTQFFNNTYVPYDATFLCVDPFAYAATITASGTVPSGTVTYTGTLTVSGSAFAEPTLTINPRGANIGNSGITALKVTHIPSGETMTMSGVFNYASSVIADYSNYLVTNSGVSSDYTGIFSRWEPGANQFTLTVLSGVRNSFNYTFSYQPRYYQ
jgi:hypothetical protein